MSYSDAGLRVVLRALDEMDIDGSDQEGALAALTKVEESYSSLIEQAWESMEDPGPNHPSHDSWPEHVWYARTLAAGGANRLEEARDEARAALDLLRKDNTADAMASVCGLVLYELHEYVKSKLGLTGGPARRSHQGRSHLGEPDAFLIWEGRNQHQHVTDPIPDPRPPGREAFSAMMAHRPDLFGRSGHSTPTQSEVDAVLTQRSWSREVLVALDLTTASKVFAALPAI